MTEILGNIDEELQKANLMEQLLQQNEGLASAFEDDQATQEARNAQKRAALLARRKAKQKQKLEEQKIADKIELIKIEEEEKQKISEDYIKELFARKAPDGARTERLDDKEKE